MKKVIALLLAAILLLSGCSNVSQEGSNLNTASSSTNEAAIINSSSNNSVPQSSPIDHKKEEQFNAKCKELLKTMTTSMAENSYDFQAVESAVQYGNSNEYMSKLYTIKDDNDDRYLFGLMDIYSNDEYEFFQNVKGFVSFAAENALEGAGRDQFMIAINPNETGTAVLSILYSVSEGSSIIYADRSVRSAYSDRLKSINILKDSTENLTLGGLIKYDDVSQLYTPYDISCDFQGKKLTHQWYKLDDEKTQSRNVFVTYIDDETYSNISDEELIYYAYSSALDPNNTGATNYYNDGHYFAYKTSNDIACSIHYYVMGGEIVYFSCTWSGEYEYLNSNPLNEQLKAALNEQTSQ